MNNPQINWALDHFNVTINDLQRIIATAMERGATYADIYFEHGHSNNVRLIDNNVDNNDTRMGTPSLSGLKFHRSNAVFRNLPELSRTVARLEKEIAELKK